MKTFSSKILTDFFILLSITIGLTFLIWLPYLLKLPNFWGLNFSEGFATIYRNFDGLEYIYIAKTFYNPLAVAQLHQALPASYFPSHFPGFPILIALLAPFLGFLKSMLFVSLFFTAASAMAFYILAKDIGIKNPLWLSTLFLFLPARWVIVHSVGSPEPMFIFFTILAIYFFRKFENLNDTVFLWAAAISASLAQLTRPPGILIFIALFAYLGYKFLQNKNFKKLLLLPFSYLPLMLVPVTLLGVFYLFQLQLGDFFAYFHSGDNIHLTLPPFQVFNKSQFWVGDIWLEDIIYIFILGFLGGLLLIKQKLYPLAFFVLTYLMASILIAHRDISRYVLPIFPFVLIAFEKALSTKEFKIVFAIVILAIYLYSQNFLLANTAPIANLQPLN